MKDWPVALIRSEARDTLAQQIYEARCKWLRHPAEWDGLSPHDREVYRMCAEDVILRKLNVE